MEQRLADRYGAAEVAALEEVLQFGLARKLRRFIGGKPALLVALALSGARLRTSRAVAPSLAEALRIHLGSVVAQNAVATSSFDLAGTERCRRTLAELQALIALARQRCPDPQYARAFKTRIVDAGLLTIGIMQCWRQDRAALAIADRIEQLGPLNALGADHLRASYYTGSGDMGLAAR